MKLSLRHALVIWAMLAFSLMALFTRGADASIVGVAAWRAVFVALAFAVWAAWAEGFDSVIRPDAKTRKLGLLYGLALALASSTFVAGYALTTVANTIFFHNLAPIAAFPLAWWAFRERPNPSAITGGVVAMLGVALMSGVSLFHLGHFTNPRFILGDVLSVVSALGYAGVLVMTRATRRAETPILGTLFLAWTIAAVVLVVIALFTGDLAVPPRSLIWIFGLAIICTNVPFYLLNLGMRHVSAGLASVLSLSEVVFATALGVLVYQESLAPLGWIGGLLVILGVLYPLAVSDETGVASESLERMDDATLQVRVFRLLLALVLLNGGAFLAISQGSGAGEVLAWVGAIGLLRLGRDPAAAALDSKMARVLAAFVGVGALAVLAGLLLRRGWSLPAGDIWVAILAVAACWVDFSLSRHELPQHRDSRLAGAAALVLLAGSQGLALLGHPSARLLVCGSALLLAMEALALLAGAIRNSGGLAGAGLAPELSRVESLVRRCIGKPILALLVLGVWGLGGLTSVPPGHVGIVERLGFPVAEVRPSGLVVHLPPPLERIVLVDVEQVRRLSFQAPEPVLLTGDQSMVSLEASLHYRVQDAHAYVYGASNPDSVLKNIANAALLRKVGTLTQDSVLTTGRRALEEEVNFSVQKIANQALLGLEVLDVRISLAAPPPAVTAAFMDVISADEEKQTRINQALAYAAEVKPLAAGKAISRLEAAAGRAVEIKARAEVQHLLFEALVRGGARSPELTRHRVGRERLEQILSETQLVVAPGNVRVWLGDTQAHPVDPQSPAKSRSTP